MAVEPSGGNAFASSPVKPEIAAVDGARIYDSAIGKTCHQCRQIRDFAAACKNRKNNKSCKIKLCHKCLLNRYGEKAEEVAAFAEWSCPKCRGICNCSVCMKKRGHQPTGILINTAKASGFSSVSEMLLKGTQRLDHEEVGGVAASPKKKVGFSPRKKGKENSFEGSVNATLLKSFDKNSKKVKRVLSGNMDNENSSKINNQEHDKGKIMQEVLEDIDDHNRVSGVLSNETGLYVCEKKAKKMKCDKSCLESNIGNGKDNLETRVHGDEKKPKKSMSDELEENDYSNKKDLSIARGSITKNLEVSNKMSNQGENLCSGGDLIENLNHMIVATKRELVQTFDNDKINEEEDSNTANADYHADIPLPVGTELTIVAGVDVRSEDIGNALQFLEFCSVFGKVLELRKGQAEYVLRDLLHGRTARRGKFSPSVQFHIQMLSIIQTEQGDESVALSPSYGKSSWFNALKKCLSESQSILEAQGVSSLEKAADYETLNASEKLRVLNLLCDEVLGTRKVRNWIDEQNTNRAQKVKEAKQKVLAAKDEEKNLKQKMKDDIAAAMIARNGALLSSSEQSAIVSRTKSEVEQAHAKLLESKGMLLNSNQTSDAVRIEPIFMEHGGHVYWKLNCLGESDVLHQNIGKGDTLSLDEKWYALDAEEKEVLEKHISSSQGKLRAPGIPASFQH